MRTVRRGMLALQEVQTAHSMASLVWGGFMQEEVILLQINPHRSSSVGEGVTSSMICTFAVNPES